MAIRSQDTASTDVSFIFFDESHCASPRSTSLTGLVVPLEVYAAVRSAFYTSLEWSITDDGKTIRLNDLPELHASQLLPAENDQRKIEQLHSVVDIIIEHDLHAIRVTCSREGHALDHFRSKKGALSLCWSQMIQICQPLWEITFVIPVVDGLDSEISRTFSGSFHHIWPLRGLLGDAAISISNLDHIADVVYADSKFSACIQMVDIVSYLRTTVQRSSEAPPLSAFRRRMLPVAERSDAIITEVDGTIRVEDHDGTTIG